MKIVKTSIIVLAIAIMSSFFSSCQKENIEAIPTDSEVSFAIQGSNLKNSQGFNLSDADKIILTIQKSDGSSTKYTSSELKIEKMNGNYYTKKIVLKTGSYQLTEFLVLDAAGITIFATPQEGSQEAQNVSNSLPVAFTVAKDVTTPVGIQVLSTEKKKPEDFGLNHFPIVEVKTFGFMIGVVDKESSEILSTNITVSNGTYSYVQDLDAILNNVVNVKDALPEYSLMIEKAGYQTYTHTFTIAEIKTYLNDAGNEPLLIELEKLVTDIDGNEYHTVTIGTQVWLIENLKTTKYNDGTDITNVTDDDAWTTAGAAYCWFNNDAATYKATCGALYNWYAVDPASNGGKNIAPVGWHVPTDAEWTTLVTYLGGESVAGGKMKEVGTAHWNSPNTGADNSSGFTALSSGYRANYWGGFMDMGITIFMWSSTADGASNAWGYPLGWNGTTVVRYNFLNQHGFSVRCIKD